MKNGDPMFDIKGAKIVVLEENLTSGSKILSADGVDEIHAKKNHAGVKQGTINADERSGKNKYSKIIIFLKFLLKYLLIPLLVIFIAFKLGWSD